MVKKLSVLVVSLFVFFAFVLGVSAAPDDPGEPFFPPEVSDCLIEAFGEERLHAIESGQSEPTAAEQSQIEQCFDAYYGPFPDFTPPPDTGPYPEEPFFPPEVSDCLIAAFGEERFHAIESGQSEPTAAEQSKIEQCFDAYYGPFPDFTPPPDPGPYPEGPVFPPEVSDCLIAAFGEERFHAIESGQSEPTAAEQSKIEQCFDAYYGSGSEPAPPPTSGDHPELPYFPSDVIECLIDAVGEERFHAIESGQSEPTPEEMALGLHCFETYSGAVPPPPSGAPPVEVGLSPELIDCLKHAIGEERFEAISSGQAQPTPVEVLLGEQCFDGFVSPAPDGAPEREAAPDMGLDPWLEACLLEAVGSQRFYAISSGQSQPTDIEEQKGMACFAKLGHEPPTVVSSPDHTIETEVIQCLKLALGEERFFAISDGSASPTLADRNKAEKCFGSTPAPISPPPHVVLDESFIDCLINAVGEERFQAISLGESQPTPEEREEGAACFPSSQSEGDFALDVVLPLAADQIPYVPENPGAISVDDIFQEADDDPTDDTETVTIEGTAPPGEVVDIYVHSSTAIVASTEADSSGKWSYTVAGLEKGSHLVYAVARVDGETERSVGTTFQAGADGGTSWILWGLLGAVAAILVLMVLWRVRPGGATRRPTPQD